MAKKKSSKAGARTKVEDSLARLARKLDESRATKRGDIVLRLSGSAAGEFRLASGPGKTKLTSSPQGAADRRPLVEVWGDADVVRAILDGDKDAVKQFMAGGLRIRGDLRYFSDLAVELGILETPL